MLESKYCEANNLQGKEPAASGNASGKSVKEVFGGKTKITDNVKTTSLSQSTKKGNSNSNVSNRIKEMGDSINTNN